MSIEERTDAQKKAERGERTKITRNEKKYREETFKWLKLVARTASILAEEIDGRDAKNVELNANLLFGDDYKGGYTHGYIRSAESAYKEWRRWKEQKEHR